MRQSAFSLCIALTILAGACSRLTTTPTAPSSAVASSSTAVTLTVRVLTRSTEAPIAGALVSYNGQGSYTDRSGELLVTVVRGQETTVQVSAAGYAPMTASAVLGGDELWTFYLLPVT